MLRGSERIYRKPRPQGEHGTAAACPLLCRSDRARPVQLQALPQVLAELLRVSLEFLGFREVRLACSTPREHLLREHLLQVREHARHQRQLVRLERHMALEPSHPRELLFGAAQVLAEGFPEIHVSLGLASPGA